MWVVYILPDNRERKKNVFSYNERHLFDFDNANAINYNVGPIRMELDIYNKIIVVKTTRECINIFKTLTPILIEAWECDGGGN